MLSPTRLLHILGPATVAALSDDDGDGLADAAVLAEVLAIGERAVRVELARAGLAEDAVLTPHLEDLAATLAAEALFHRRREVLPEVWRHRADRARDVLRQIGDGSRVVPGLTPARIASVDTDAPLHRIPRLKSL